MNDRDPGLQPERTRLAWSRTIISMLVNALLLARVMGGSNAGWIYALAVGCLLAGIGCAAAKSMKRKYRSDFGARRAGAMAGLAAFCATSACLATSGMVIQWMA